MQQVNYPSIKDKVVVVTGAARGIGKATAIAFAKQGAKLVIDDLFERSELLNKTKAEIEKIGVAVEAVIADVRDEGEVKKLIKTSVDVFGKIDVLVNNAGIVFDVEWETKTRQQWQDTLNTNLVGPYFLIRAAHEQLVSSKGVVVNITSTNAYKAMSPFSLDYDASKAGLMTLTHNIAHALAPDVRVNAIAPGWVDTDMNADLPDGIVKEETAKIFKERFATPSEIASVVVFLASDEASYINGATIAVDGGYQ